MSAGLKPYPAYGDSGTEWLGEIPAHWNAQQLGRFGGFFKGNGGTKGDEIPEGVPCIRYGDIYTQYQFFVQASRSCVSADRAHDYTPIRYGDVLFAASGETLEEIGKSVVNLIRSRACCGGDVIVFRPSIDVAARFMGYATDCHRAAFQKSRMGRGITVMHLYGSQLKYMWIALPPLDEQATIADFLDRETEKIDALVAKKQRLIELLQEKRTALISHAVTKGLDPDVPTKDCGSSWWGAAPAHWSASKLGRVAASQGGMTPDKGKSEYWQEGTIPWVSPKDLKVEMLLDSEDHVTELGLRDTGLRLIAPPAVLVVVRGMILAHSFPVTTICVPVTINQDLKALTAREGCSPRYLHRLLQGTRRLMLSYVDDAAHGTKRVRTELWRNAPVFLPPAAEQAELCKRLDGMERHLVELESRVQLALERLLEYRSGLVTAAVTGQIDVRTYRREAS